jgi:SAM-dependent methyltransferase
MSTPAFYPGGSNYARIALDPHLGHRSCISTAAVALVPTTPCPVCGASEAEPLIPPHSFRSATTGGTILKAPLRKLQCLSCGVGRQLPITELGDKIAFYRDHYGRYHKRAGTSASELYRYRAMARWILEELGDFRPTSVLDVGCGGGYLLEALRGQLGTLACAGVDPSLENSEAARDRGLTVVTGNFPGSEHLFAGLADLVVTANVVSHIHEPSAFLAAMADCVTEGGRIVIYGHNGDQASADLLWTDIDYSFCREHLITIASKVGLRHLNQFPFSPPAGQEDKYVLVFQKSGQAEAAALTDKERSALLDARRRYFGAWRTLAHRLNELDASRPIYNFGASFWAIALAVYCPRYWGGVDACVVDEGGGDFFGKPIIPISKVKTNGQRPQIVLGTNPSSQPQLAKKLSTVADVTRWDDLLHR